MSDFLFSFFLLTEIALLIDIVITDIAMLQLEQKRREKTGETEPLGQNTELWHLFQLFPSIKSQTDKNIYSLLYFHHTKMYLEIVT